MRLVVLLHLWPYLRQSRQKNFAKEFEIPVEVYKRFALPSQYLYDSNNSINKKANPNLFRTKRNTLSTLIHENRKDVAEEWSKIEESIVNENESEIQLGTRTTGKGVRGRSAEVWLAETGWLGLRHFALSYQSCKGGIGWLCTRRTKSINEDKRSCPTLGRRVQVITCLL